MSALRTEARLRGLLKRRGYGLRKSHSRTYSNPEYGYFFIYDIATGLVETAETPLYSLELDEVAAWVNDLIEEERTS